MDNVSRSFLLTAVALGSIAAAEPRQPTARWVVNYDDAQCVASRNYGTADKPLFLAFKPSTNGSVMRIMLMRNGSALSADERPATLRFNDNPSITLSALAHGDRQTKRLVTSINLPMTTFTANRRASAISIKAGSFDEQFAVSGLTGAAAALADCLANLREVWNVGEPFAGQLKQPARPTRSLARLFSPSRYPTQAINAGNSGKVGISMLVDEAGSVRDCMVEETSGFATLDTMSCFVIVSQAKFTPAIGPDGKPAKSAYFQRIDWRIHSTINAGQAPPTASREPVAQQEVRSPPPQ
jgi:TonB family protein